jgi:hypothetical protein
MMNAAKHLIRHLSGEQTRREIDEELRLHLDLLTEENCRNGMSIEEARDAAHTRFGDLGQITDQCVEISKRSQPALLALKSFLILIFLAGVLVRIFGLEFHVTRVGNILMFVAILSRVLLYLRSVGSSMLASKRETEPPLRLGIAEREIKPYDRHRRTPLERVISDK